MDASGKATLLEFALIEYERRGWDMPDIHVRLFDWLDRTRHERSRVLRIWRGASKSTSLAIYNAHAYYLDPSFTRLVQGADDDLAVDLSRDTLAILRAHPLTQGLVKEIAGVEQWWTVDGFAVNARTPQMRARGILSRTTGSRAAEIQNDDVEVEKNVDTQEARKKLRKKLGEQTHILLPGGSRLYVGTPHTHDSLYDEEVAGGAVHFTQPLFAHSKRYEKTSDETLYRIPGPIGPDGVWVFSGIGRTAKLLAEGLHYEVTRGYVQFATPPDTVIDVCTGNAWPERFHRQEMIARRRECRTFGEWDSQYQLEAKPINEVRLDPERMHLYEVEPQLITRNGRLVMMLGMVEVVGVTARWDVSLGKINSDASALCVVFTDAQGRLYWHRAVDLEGDLEQLSPVDGTLIGGQVKQLIDVCVECNVPHVTVETNGPGGFVPAIARKHCDPLGISVSEEFSTVDKRKRILDAFEPPLSSRFLYAHTSVAYAGETDEYSAAWLEMRDFDPSVREQKDDFVDAAAGAIAATPVRVERQIGRPTVLVREWGGEGEVCETTLVGFD